MATLHQLYARFEQDLSGPAVAGMERLIAAKPSGGYGQNVYRFEALGLEHGTERERFAQYITAFDV